MKAEFYTTFDGSHMKDTETNFIQLIYTSIPLRIEFFRNPKRGPKPGPLQIKDRDLV